MDHPVVLFDGVCNLCNGSVSFLIKNDKSNSLRFASLQSATADRLLQENKCLQNKMASFLFIENGRIYEKSTAALKVARYLPWYWKWTTLFLWIPKSLRDAVYDFIAARRYRWFGKKEQCMIPGPELRSRFLD